MSLILKKENDYIYYCDSFNYYLPQISEPYKIRKNKKDIINFKGYTIDEAKNKLQELLKEGYKIFCDLNLKKEGA